MGIGQEYVSAYHIESVYFPALNISQCMHIHNINNTCLFYWQRLAYVTLNSEHENVITST